METYSNNSQIYLFNLLVLQGVIKTGFLTYIYTIAHIMILLLPGNGLHDSILNRRCIVSFKYVYTCHVNNSIIHALSFLSLFQLLIIIIFENNIYVKSHVYSWPKSVFAFVTTCTPFSIFVIAYYLDSGQLMNTLNPFGECVQNKYCIYII